MTLLSCVYWHIYIPSAVVTTIIIIVMIIIRSPIIHLERRVSPRLHRTRENSLADDKMHSLNALLDVITTRQCDVVHADSSWSLLVMAWLAVAFE